MIAKAKRGLAGWIARWGTAQNATLQQSVTSVHHRLDEVSSVMAMWHLELLQRVEDLSARVDQLSARVDQVTATASAAVRLAGVTAGVPGEALPPVDGPVVSIVVPAHGAAPLLARALRSIAVQTYTRFECFVVNDGDDTRVAAGFAAVADDPRFSLLPIERSGVCGARNAGLAAGSGELIAFLDADNEWTAWHLAASVSAFEDASVQATYAAMLIERAGGVVDSRSQPFDREALLQECFIDLNVLVHRRSLFEQQGGFDESIQRLVDWDYVARLTQHVPAMHLRHVGCIYDDRDADRISTTRPVGPSWYAIRSKWRGEPAAGARVLWVTPTQHGGVPTIGSAEVDGMRSLGADVRVWSPSRSEPSPVAELREFAPHVVHFATASLAERHLSAARREGMKMVAHVHRPAQHQALLAALAADPAVASVIVPPGAGAGGVWARSFVEMPGLFSPGSVGPWRGATKDRRLVALAAHAHVRGGLSQILEVASACPDFRFAVAVPAASRSRRLASFVHQSALLPNLINLPVRSDAEVADVFRAAALSLHTEPAWWVDGPLSSVGSVAIAAAVGCVPVISSAGAGRGFEFSSVAFDSTEQAASLLAETTSWPDARWRDLQRWALDEAWVHRAAPQVLVSLFPASR